MKVLKGFVTIYLHFLHLLQLKHQILGFLKIFNAKLTLNTNITIISSDKNIEIKLNPLKSCKSL